MIKENIDKMVMLAMKSMSPIEIFGKTNPQLETVHASNITNALKQVKTELVNAEKSGKPFDEFAILKKLKKQHEESIEAYKLNGRDELAKNESDELVVIKMLLPEEVSESVIESEVDKIITEIAEDHDLSKNDIGTIMKSLKAKYKNIDGKTASEIIRKKLGI